MPTPLALKEADCQCCSPQKKDDKREKRDFVPSFLLMDVPEKLCIPVGLLLVLLLALPSSTWARHPLMPDIASVVPPCLVASDESDRQWATTWLTARQHVRDNRRDQAIKLYEELLTRRPELLAARWEYSQLLLAAERFERAEESLEDLLEIKPDNIDYLQALGTLLLLTDRLERAVLYLARVWQMDQERYEVGMALYRAYSDLGQQEEALPVLEDLHRKRPEDMALQRRLFRLYVELGNDQLAQPLGAALANGPDVSFEILEMVAQVHDRLELSHLAAEYWKKIIEQRPDFSVGHARLADYYSRQGREAEALPHLLHGYEENPDDDRLAGRIGVIYANRKNHEQAVRFLEQYLDSQPKDARKNLILAQSYKALGFLRKSSTYYSRYLDLVDEPADTIRLQAAEVFSATAERKKALEQYQKLAVGGAMSDKYLVELARNLAATGQYEKALSRWREVAASRPHDLQSRLEIIALLEELGRDRQRVALLEEVHGLDNGNHLVNLKLAEHYFRQGRSDAAWRLFEPLAEMEFFSPDFLKVRARIFFFLDLPEHAFADMVEVVAKGDVSPEHRLLFLEIAGALGRLDIVREQAVALAKVPHFLAPAGRLAYARALGRAGAFAQADNLYRALLFEPDAEIRVAARLGAAEMYRLYGFYHEAEEQYRLAWLDGHELRPLYELVELNLALGRNEAAEAWLAALVALPAAEQCRCSFYRLRLLNDRHEFEEALLLGRHIRAGQLGFQCNTEMQEAVGVEVARARFGVGDEVLGESMLTDLVARRSRNFAAHAALFDVHRQRDDKQAANRVRDRALDIAAYDAGLLETFMELALHQDLTVLASGAGRVLRDKTPRSFGFLLRLVRILEMNEELDEAENLVVDLLRNHADNVLLNLFGARLALDLGHYEKGLERINRVLAEKPGWPAALLVKARLEWALFHWPEALAVYQQALKPAAEDTFLEDCAARHIEVPPHEELALWEKVIQPMGRQGPLKRSLDVDFVTSGHDEDVAQQASRYYALYRWQEVVRRELAARKSVQRREYHHAVKQYEVLLRDQDEPTLLFDLAGVYSSLDRVGDEGMVYQRLKKEQPDFPGLNEAMARNHLKRRPQTGFFFSQQQKKGRDGYFDLRKNESGVRGWLSPRPQREIKVTASHIHYESLQGDDDHYGRQADISLVTNFFDHLQFQATLGGHLLSDNQGSVGLYDFSVTGLAGDRFESYIGIKRQMVTDTLASVKQTIMAHVYEARAELDLMSWLQAGGDLSHTEYSDDNEVNGYSFWLSSVLSPEPHFLKATFLYEFLDAREEGKAPAGILLEDQPYWSPEQYWRNQFRVTYKHKFSDDVLGRSTPGFFTAGYGFTYDVDEDPLHVFRVGLHVEMSRSWIFKVDSEFEEGKEYRTRNISAALLYRW